MKILNFLKYLLDKQLIIYNYKIHNIIIENSTRSKVIRAHFDIYKNYSGTKLLFALMNPRVINTCMICKYLYDVLFIRLREMFLTN